MPRRKVMKWSILSIIWCTLFIFYLSVNDFFWVKVCAFSNTRNVHLSTINTFNVPTVDMTLIEFTFLNSLELEYIFKFFYSFIVSCHR